MRCSFICPESSLCVCFYFFFLLFKINFLVLVILSHSVHNYRRLKRNFSNCKKLSRFLGTKRNGHSMIRLVVLMMLWVLLLLLLLLQMNYWSIIYWIYNLQLAMSRNKANPYGLLNLIPGNCLVALDQNIETKQCLFNLQKITRSEYRNSVYSDTNWCFLSLQYTN